MTHRGSKGGASGRGFASMDGEAQKRIAREGGRAAHAKGTAHEFTSEEAREAGRKGGASSHGGGRSRIADRDRDEELRS